MKARGLAVPVSWVLESSGNMKFITRTQLSELAERLMEQGRAVYAPVKQERGDFLFQELLKGQEVISEDYSNTAMPGTEIFYPFGDTLFTYGNGAVDASLPEPRAKAVFGIRPCDLAGLLILDRFFMENQPEDPRYRARRENTLIFSLDCIESCEKGFCYDAGTGPLSRKGHDAALFPLEDGYLVREVSPRVEELFASFPEAKPQHLKALEEFKREMPGRFAGRIPGGAEAFEASPPDPEDPLWSYLSKRCFGCGGCCYVCPTCYCYNTVDTGQEMLRERDSCLLKGYHWLAGGGSLRPRREDRVRYRYECKFSNAHEERFGRKPCVGCGRCSWTCIGFAAAETYYLKREALK